MQNVWQDFKDFAIGGNLVQLAVAFVLGLAFTAVVTSLVNDIFMPIIGAIVSDKSFAALSFDIGGATVMYGNFLTVMVTFVLFLVVQGYNELRKHEAAAPVDIKSCPYCLSDIPLAATRCPSCTSEL